MIIPWNALQPETLHKIIESFILREGTDYGESEIPLSEKVEQVRQQILSGEVIIVWSELHESLDLKRKSDGISSRSSGY